MQEKMKVIKIISYAKMDILMKYDYYEEI